jgi:hypothetical protein
VRRKLTSIFEELRVAYRASQETYREYARDSLVAAQQLAHGFREYIGAPETYTDPDDETKRPYVRLLSFQIQEGLPVAAQPEAHSDILTREDDGFWRFAISLSIDRDADTFPKQQLAFFLRLKLHGGIRHVQLLDDGFQDFRVPGTGETDEHALFDHMVGMVNRVLSAKPWEGVEKLPIGFELHRPDLPLDSEPPPEPPLAQP